MSKTEDQIAKDKEAVQKMIGAKTAMVAAIERIAELERTIELMARSSESLARDVGDKTFVKVAEYSAYSSLPGLKSNQFLTAHALLMAQASFGRSRL